MFFQRVPLHSSTHATHATWLMFRTSGAVCKPTRPTQGKSFIEEQKAAITKYLTHRSPGLSVGSFLFMLDDFLWTPTAQDNGQGLGYPWAGLPKARDPLLPPLPRKKIALSMLWHNCNHIFANSQTQILVSLIRTVPEPGKRCFTHMFQRSDFSTWPILSQIPGLVEYLSFFPWEFLKFISSLLLRRWCLFFQLLSFPFAFYRLLLYF